MPEEHERQEAQQEAEALAFLPANGSRHRHAPPLIASRSRRTAVDKISEVVKPGSTFIISDYDVAKSEIRYLGTDFIVQMPEVVAKISRPKPKRDEYYEEDDCGWSFFGPRSSQAAPGAPVWRQVLLLGRARHPRRQRSAARRARERAAPHRAGGSPRARRGGGGGGGGPRTEQSGAAPQPALAPFALLHAARR